MANTTRDQAMRARMKRLKKRQDAELGKKKSKQKKKAGG